MTSVSVTCLLEAQNWDNDLRWMIPLVAWNRDYPLNPSHYGLELGYALWIIPSEPLNWGMPFGLALACFISVLYKWFSRLLIQLFTVVRRRFNDVVSIWGYSFARRRNRHNLIPFCPLHLLKLRLGRRREIMTNLHHTLWWR